MLLSDYIAQHHNGIRAEFARSQGVSPQLVNKWLGEEWAVIDGKLCSPKHCDFEIVNGRLYIQKKVLKK